MTHFRQFFFFSSRNSVSLCSSSLPQAVSPFSSRLHSGSGWSGALCFENTKDLCEVNAGDDNKLSCQQRDGRVANSRLQTPCQRHLRAAPGVIPGARSRTPRRGKYESHRASACALQLDLAAGGDAPNPNAELSARGEGWPGWWRQGQGSVQASRLFTIRFNTTSGSWLTSKLRLLPASLNISSYGDPFAIPTRLHPPTRRSHS